MAEPQAVDAASPQVVPIARWAGPSSAEPLIVTEGLTKEYRGLTALEDCWLEVPRGAVFGLLGPNGAGKSTLLRLLMGFLRPTRGRALVLGRDCHRDYVAVHRQVAYMPGDARLPGHMTGRQVLEFFSRLRTGLPAELGLAIARRLDLDLRRRVVWMSTGMRQKLALAATLATEAPVMILDEPTSNLDPTVRAEVLQLVRECQASGQTIVFSSHVLSETEAICQRVAILRRGRLVYTQCIDTLRRQHRVKAQLTVDLPPVPEAWRDQLIVEHDPVSKRLRLDTLGDLGPLLGWLSTLGLTEVSIEPIGLQSIYERWHPAANLAELSDEEPR